MSQDSAVQAPTFGTAFTAHMITTRWTEQDGWQDPVMQPYGPLPMDPAAVGMHYGQAVFEGLKAFRQADGTIAVFRPDRHARRFRDSARRLVMPELPEELFLAAVRDLVAKDGDQLPDSTAVDLYLRPLLFATEPCLALRPAREHLFSLIAFVTGGFFGDRPSPITVMVNRRHSRATPGGTGAAKFAGNYAAAYQAQAEAAAAGCHQVVWLDALEGRWIEELGATNLFFVRDGELVTPRLTGTLLPGITRDSLLTIAADLGYGVTEDRVSVTQWRDESRSGVITETFACGTAAAVTPVGQVHDVDGDWTIGGNAAGPVTLALRDALLAIQHGEAPDRHGWLVPVR